MMLRLADLNDLARPGSGAEDLGFFDVECRRRGLDWPSPVIERFLFDHGTKSQFQEQYGDLDLVMLRWQFRSLLAGELVDCTYDEDLGGRVQSVSARPHWTLKEYRIHRGVTWQGTWSVPPILIEGALRNPLQPELHLVEGHTRLGVLIGLVGMGEVALDSAHFAYVASISGRGSR